MCLGVLFIKGESCCQENSASRGLTLQHMIFQGTFLTGRDWRPTCGHVPRRKEGRCHLGRSGIFRFFLVDSTYKQYRAEVRGRTFLPSGKLQRHCSARYIILGVQVLIFVRPIKNEGLTHRNIIFVEILKTPFLKNKWFTRVQKRMRIFTIESFYLSKLLEHLLGCIIINYHKANSSKIIDKQEQSYFQTVHDNEMFKSTWLATEISAVPRTTTDHARPLHSHVIQQAVYKSLYQQCPNEYWTGHEHLCSVNAW
jgi:hypothetical protein